MGRIRNILHEGRIFLGYLFIWMALFTTLVWFSGQQYNILPTYSIAQMGILVLIGLLLSRQKKGNKFWNKCSWLLPIIIFVGGGGLMAFYPELKESANINIFMGMAALISLVPTMVQAKQLFKVFRNKRN